MNLELAQLFDESTRLPPDTLLGNKYLDPNFLYDKEVGVLRQVWNFLSNPDTGDAYRNLLFLLGIFFLSIIFYSLIRVLEIRKKEEAHLHHEMREYAHHHADKEKTQAEGESVSRNSRWRQVLHLLFAESPNEWRLSVIEADAMLEALLGELGFQGEDLGEKLKNAGAQGFRHLNTAWEAHIIRNRIAHEGSIFELSHHEAKRVIALYESIFRDFGYI